VSERTTLAAGAGSPAAFAFELTHRDGRARRGRLTTPHGVVETPAFMPVGTRGAVKALGPHDLETLGASILLANTYHLHLRPGDALIARRGGLHRFIGWDRPMLTDSGGYQVFSLADRRTVSEDGVTFRSHLDGARLHLTPERVVDVQARLGSDITMVLDECVAAGVSRGEAESTMRRTLRWARRARDRFEALRAHPGEVAVTNPGQAQFGIVQGGRFPDLRIESAGGTVAIGFEAYALGGLSVGEPADEMYAVVETTAAHLPQDRPRYLMGSGLPDDLVEAVARGIDLFDCVLPTRNARNGQLFTRHGRLNIKNAAFAEDDRPIDEACGCPTCRRHSRAYLRHLFVAGEPTAMTLNTVHNLYFYLDTMRGIRDAISFGCFDSFREEFHRTFSRERLCV
jgi:queuine tRNA-ribosyltransferase